MTIFISKLTRHILMNLTLSSQAVFMVGFSSDADKLFADANQTASEAFNSIRTVSDLAMHCHHTVTRLSHFL